MKFITYRAVVRKVKNISPKIPLMAFCSIEGWMNVLSIVGTLFGSQGILKEHKREPPVIDNLQLTYPFVNDYWVKSFCSISFEVT